MTKLYRVVAYVLNLNNSVPTKEDVIQQLERSRYGTFINVSEVLETDCGEWNDDHELNHANANYDKYFPELSWPKASLGDRCIIKRFQDMRTELLRREDEIAGLKHQARRDREELDKLKKVQEFVKTIGDIIKSERS